MKYKKSDLHLSKNNINFALYSEINPSCGLKTLRRMKIYEHDHTWN